MMAFNAILFLCFCLALHTSGWVVPRLGLPLFQSRFLQRRSITRTNAMDWTALTHASLDTAEKKEAFDILDCITCPNDPNDPLYDVNKDVRRDKLIATNEYSALKYQLMDKGLDSSGDKLEMLTRLNLHIIDPSIQYQQLTGLEEQLSYVTDEDVAAGLVHKNTPEEIAALHHDIHVLGNVDADDLRVIRAPPADSEAAADFQPRRRMLLDGLSRKETAFSPVRVQRSEQEAKKEDQILLREAVPFTGLGPEDNKKLTVTTKERQIGAYVVTNRLKLKAWDTSTAIVLLPSGSDYWRDKEIRILADKLSYTNQCTVIVPDIYRSQSFRAAEPDPSSNDETNRDDAENTLKMFRGKIFKTREEWLAHQDPKRVFDDIVATVGFLRGEYKVKNFALYGVGDGGGMALEAACTLGDLARLGMYTQIEDALLEQKIISPLTEGSDEIPFDAVEAAIEAALTAESGPAFEVLEKVIKENMLTFPRQPLQNQVAIRREEEEDEQTRIHEEAAARGPLLPPPLPAPATTRPTRPRAVVTPQAKPKLWAETEDEDDDADEEAPKNREEGDKIKRTEEGFVSSMSSMSNVSNMSNESTPAVAGEPIVIETPLGGMHLDVEAISRTIDESDFLKDLMQMDSADLVKEMELDAAASKAGENTDDSDGIGEGVYSDFVPQAIAESPVFQSIEEIVSSTVPAEEPMPLSAFLKAPPTDQEVEDALRNVDVAALLERSLKKIQSGGVAVGSGAAARASAVSSVDAAAAGAGPQKQSTVAVSVAAPEVLANASATNITTTDTNNTRTSTGTSISTSTKIATTDNSSATPLATNNSPGEWVPDLRYINWTTRNPTEAERTKIRELNAADNARVLHEVYMKHLRREWPQILRAAKRTERRRVLDPFSTFSVTDFAPFVPRLVMAFTPEGHDAEKVSRELSVSPLLYYGEGRVSKATPLQDDEFPPAVDEISTLCEGLEARGDEVADYSFRLFSDARTDFVHKVSDDYDARCSQMALLEASAWFDSYSTLTETECRTGFGQNKQEESLFAVFFPEDMDQPVEELNLATYLHDDPTNFRNNQLDV